MIIQSIIGLAVFILVAAALSENRKKISFPFIFIALGLQLIIGFVFLKSQMIRQVFLYLNELVLAVESAIGDGTSMVFSYLGGGPLPFKEPYPGAAFILAFKALPIYL
jgi:CNT family concentrative nucleoside transporter